MALREGIVVGDVRAAVGLGDAQIGEQKGHGLGGHGGTPVGVEGELAGDDLVDRRSGTSPSPRDCRAGSRRSSFRPGPAAAAGWPKTWWRGLRLATATSMRLRPNAAMRR